MKSSIAENSNGSINDHENSLTRFFRIVIYKFFFMKYSFSILFVPLRLGKFYEVHFQFLRLLMILCKPRHLPGPVISIYISLIFAVYSHH